MGYWVAFVIPGGRGLMPRTPVCLRFQLSFCHVYFSNQSKAVVENYLRYCVRSLSAVVNAAHYGKVLPCREPASRLATCLAGRPFPGPPTNLYTLIFIKIKLNHITTFSFFLFPSYRTFWIGGTNQSLPVYLLGSWLISSIDRVSTHQGALTTPQSCFQGAKSHSFLMTSGLFADTQ